LLKSQEGYVSAYQRGRLDNHCYVVRVPGLVFPFLTFPKCFLISLKIEYQTIKKFARGVNNFASSLIIVEISNILKKRHSDRGRAEKLSYYAIRRRIGKGVCLMLHNILWAIIVLVLIVWLLGLIFRVGRGLIHLLLIVAAVIIIFNLLFP
jgi:Family of unknown function (DUF5670)